ncbi:uncharacterized protein METZ01_LOCUS486695, partial [marine metagenome]
MIPGGFQKYKKLTFKKFIQKTLTLFVQEQWAGLGHYIVTEASNILSERLIFQGSRILSCSLCRFSAPAFIHLSNSLGITWNSACPECNSRSRHRGLIFLYREYLQEKQAKKILQFAPEPVLENEIRKYKQHQYFTTDYHMSGVDFPGEDIQNLSFADSSFDLVFSNHVLEHVPDDKQAVAETARILKNGGVAIITLPGDWRRKLTRSFGHLNYNGHYREYGLDVIDLFRT